MLLTISVALFFAFLMSPSEVNREQGHRILGANTFLATYTSQFKHPLNPQMGVTIVIVSNGTLNMKLFNNHWNFTYMWVPLTGKLAVLENYTDSNPSLLTLDQNLSNGKTTFEYVPSRIEEATIIISNPTSLAVDWSYDSKTVTVIASPDRVSLALTITTPLGAALTVPRIVSTLRERRQVRKSATATRT